MRQQPSQLEQTCPRDPEVETNLRCGRCNQLICPRCLVTTPVGARCPSCARIGRPTILDASKSEMGRALAYSAGAATATGAVYAALLWAFAHLPNAFLFGAIVIGMIAVGYLVGDAVRIGSRGKLDKRLRYVAAGMTFGGYLTAVLILPVISVNPLILSSIIGLGGLIVAMYVAMARVRR